MTKELEELIYTALGFARMQFMDTSYADFDADSDLLYKVMADKAWAFVATLP